MKGISEQECTYQVTYSSVAKPVVSIDSGIPYSVRISSAEDSIRYFLYYQAGNNTIRAIQMVNAGNSDVYATPIETKNGKNMEEYLLKNL